MSLAFAGRISKEVTMPPLLIYHADCDDARLQRYADIVGDDKAQKIVTVGQRRGVPFAQLLILLGLAVRGNRRPLLGAETGDFIFIKSEIGNVGCPGDLDRSTDLIPRLRR